MQDIQKLLKYQDTIEADIPSGETTCYVLDVPIPSESLCLCVIDYNHIIILMHL